MKQEVEIKEKRISIMIAVVFIAIYIVLRKRKYEYFYDGISEYEDRYRGIFLFTDCSRFVSIL